jgi:hypothetical protein
MDAGSADGSLATEAQWPTARASGQETSEVARPASFGRRGGTGGLATALAVGISHTVRGLGGDGRVPTVRPIALTCFAPQAGRRCSCSTLRGWKLGGSPQRWRCINTAWPPACLAVTGDCQRCGKLLITARRAAVRGACEIQFTHTVGRADQDDLYGPWGPRVLGTDNAARLGGESFLSTAA